MVAAGNLGAGGGNAVGAVAHLLHGAGQRCTHGVERAQKIAEFVLALNVCALAQIAGRNVRSQFVGLSQRTLDAADKQKGARANGQYHQHHGKNADPDRRDTRGGDTLQLVTLRLLLHFHEIVQGFQVGVGRRAVAFFDERDGFLLLPIGLELSRLRARIQHGLAGRRNLRHLCTVRIGQWKGLDFLLHLADLLRRCGHHTLQRVLHRRVAADNDGLGTRRVALREADPARGRVHAQFHGGSDRVALDLRPGRPQAGEPHHTRQHENDDKDGQPELVSNSKLHHRPLCMEM